MMTASGSDDGEDRMSTKRWTTLAAAAAGVVALATPQQAVATRTLFFEETAGAFWEVPHTCADGSVVPGTLLVQTTRDFESPDTEDADPTTRLQFLAVCPDGTSFSWGAPVVPSVIVSDSDLKSVTSSGSGTARDILGVTHTVSFDAAWTGTGPLTVTVNTSGSKRKQRTATATAQVVFDGTVLVNGPSNHPTRPAPFIRVDTEK